MAVVGHGLTILGITVAVLLAYIIVISGLEHGRAQRTLRARMVKDVSFERAWVGGVIPEGEPVALLDVGKIGLHEVVVEGTTGGQLKKGPGHLRSSALPGQVGNAVITGRRIGYSGPFRHLKELNPGDAITAITGQGKSEYRVTKVNEISRDDADALDSFGDNRLTLVSSAPELAASRRLVVTAALRTRPHAIPAPRPTNIRQEELGLHSDRSTVIPLLLWSQLLLAAALGTAWLRRRWRPWPTYLIAVPVMALLALLVFDSFTPVLPSTL